MKAAYFFICPGIQLSPEPDPVNGVNAMSVKLWFERHVSNLMYSIFICNCYQQIVKLSHRILASTCELFNENVKLFVLRSDTTTEVIWKIRGLIIKKWYPISGINFIFQYNLVLIYLVQNI